MKPILRWPGGKAQLIPELKKLLTPEVLKGHTYLEPFIGGGALAFDLAHPKTVIGDLNPELTNLYKVIRDRPHRLIELLTKHQAEHSKDHYYEVRA